MRMPVTIKDRRFVLAFAGTFLILSSLMLFPDFAFASIADDINKWLCGVLRDCCNWIFANQINMLKSIGYDGILAAGFDSMLGTAGNTTMYSLVHGVWQVAILPIGCGVLGFVFTIKLIQISQKMDGNASLPGVKEVVFLLVFFAVFLFLIQNSFDLMASIYSITKLAIERVINMFGTGGAIDLNAVSIVTTDDDVAALVAMLIVALISWVVVLVAYIVALVVSWARAIQLYLMAAFSPIPHGYRGYPPDRHRLRQEFRGSVPGRHHHPRATYFLPDNPWRPQCGEPRNGYAHRRHCQRAHLCAPVPGDVHPAHLVLGKERKLGPRHRWRIEERR